MRRLLSVFLILLCCIHGAKGVTFTEGDFTFSDEPWEVFNSSVTFPSNNDYTSQWEKVIYVSEYNGNSEHVTIPTSVNYEGIDYSVRYIGPRAFWNNNTIKSVDLGSVEYIGQYAFRSCRNLSSVDLYGCKEIGEQTFAYTGLKKIAVQGGIERSSFGGCSQLTDIDVTNCYFVGGAPFEQCPNLKNIIGLEREGDMYIRSGHVMFVDRETKSIDLRGYSVDCGAIEYCSQLESVIFDALPANLSVENLPEINIFNGCHSLKEVRVYEAYYGFSPNGPQVLPYGCHLYVPYGTADSYKTYDLQISNGEMYYDYRELTDDDITEFGLRIEYNSGGTVFQYIESDNGNFTETIADGTVLVDNLKIGLEPYSYAFFESATHNGNDISYLFHDGIIDFAEAGITSGIVEIKFGSYPHIQLLVSSGDGYYSNSKIYDDGQLINSREYIIGAKEHCILVVPQEGFYVSKIEQYYPKMELTLSDANTFLVTPGGNVQTINVTFRKYPQVSVNSNGSGEVLFKGKSLYRNSQSYVVNDGKELDFYIVPDEGAVIDKVLWKNNDVTASLENRHLRVTAETHSTLSVSFVETGYATLTVEAPGHHSVITRHREGEAPSVELTPVENYKLHSVTLNGETLDVSEDGLFELPALYGENVLNAVYVESIDTGVGNLEVSDIKVTAYNHTISVLNKPADAQVEVYDLNGCVIAETAEGTVTVDESRNFVIVKVAGRAYKVAL